MRSAVWAIAVLGCSLIHASRLPIKTYTTVDGLARDHILCIVQDSHGFIWFCTAEGLSRFDGYQFTNYGTEQGLPSNVVNDFVETRRGRYWIATSGGLCGFDPGARSNSKFHCFPVKGNGAIPGASMLYEDAQGGVWCGAGRYLFHADPNASSFQPVDFQVSSDTLLSAILMDRRGALWIGASDGLYRRDPTGAVRRYTAADLPNDYIMALLEDREGRIWAGTRLGLVRFEFPSGSESAPRARVFTVKDGLPGARIESLYETSDGTIWIGTNLGIAKRIFGKPGAGREFQSYTLAQGLSARAVGSIAEDRDGNLWIGTFGSGVMKVAYGGFITHSEADGVPELGALLETPSGELWGVTREESRMQLVAFDGQRFVSVRPAWPKGLSYFGWGRSQIALQDKAGECWIATGGGLCRFAPFTRVRQLAGASPKAVYTVRQGLPGNNIFRIFQDSRSDIWIGTIGPGAEDGLSRWLRSTGEIRPFSTGDGLPRHPVPTSLAEDGSGNIWVGLFHGGLARYRRDSDRFTTFTEADGLEGVVRCLYIDSAKRLWIGTTRGLVLIDDPCRDRPRWVVYSTEQGLSSNLISSITEDRWGGIYAATGRGIDSFEPPTGARTKGLGRVRHYNSADGIAPGELEIAFRDHRGALWFTTPLGVSQFIPSQDAARSPPAVLLTGVAAGGVAHTISDLGESAISSLQLRYKTPLRIDFVGLDYFPGETLRYQYMLENADRDWGSISDNRTVLYASLAPGSYRFLVRAVTSGGAVSKTPATLDFSILPPLWRTWWFLSAFALIAAGAIFLVHRYRVSQLLAVANLRTRIATDLHDDIGASLSQIAILSEVAQRAGSESKASASLSHISEISRELIDSMSDIVWAINPDNDQLSNLVYRMRRFANDLLPSRGIALRFRSAIGDDDLKIGADTRRQMYLIFKEALHNALRHSGASNVDVDLDRLDGHIALRVSDNGRGFNPECNYDGRGLLNMRKRASLLGGSLEFTSAPGQGTVVALTAPLRALKSWQR